MFGMKMVPSLGAGYGGPSTVAVGVGVTPFFQEALFQRGMKGAQ